MGNVTGNLKPGRGVQQARDSGQGCSLSPKTFWGQGEWAKRADTADEFLRMPAGTVYFGVNLLFYPSL